MKQLTGLSAALCAAVIIFTALPAAASGVGLYVSGGYGGYRWNTTRSTALVDTLGLITPAPPRVAQTLMGGGFVYDTTLASEKIFGFRLNAGYEWRSAASHTLHGVNTAYIFSLAPVRTDRLRLWVGPLLSLQYYWGRDNNRSYAWPYIFLGVPTWAQSIVVPFMRRYRFFAFGGGIALGLNIHVHKAVTLCFEGGFRALSGAGTTGDVQSGGDLNTQGGAGYGTVSLLYRFDESR